MRSKVAKNQNTIIITRFFIIGLYFSAIEVETLVQMTVVCLCNWIWWTVIMTSEAKLLDDVVELNSAASSS